MSIAIETKGLTKDFGQGRGIFDLNLEVMKGEAFGFIGPNGAGKTTTLRLLMNLIRATSGTASIFGHDTDSASTEIKRVTGYLPAEPPEYPNHTGQSILDLLAHLQGGIDPKRVSDLAERFKLDLRRKYREYSHGNKQKVWLVQAFMFDAELYILDEPTSGLDPLMQQEFRGLVQEAKKRGATIFLSSHVLPEVQEICDRIGIVHQGALRQVGTMDELRLSHVHRLFATVEGNIDQAVLEKVGGIGDIQITDHQVRCTMNGKIEPLLEALQPYTVVSLEASEMSLEEVFLSEYGKAKQS